MEADEVPLRDDNVIVQIEILIVLPIRPYNTKQDRNELAGLVL